MVRPTKSNKLKEAPNYLIQRNSAEQMQKDLTSLVTSNLPVKSITEIHGETIIELDEAKEISPADWETLKRIMPSREATFPELNVPLARVDKSRDFVARIQAKDEAHRKEIHDGWVVSPEPQFVHLGCSKAEPGLKTVVIRKCPCAVALARDGKEPYCIACKVIVHTLNMGEAVDATQEIS